MNHNKMHGQQNIKSTHVCQNTTVR